MGLDTPTAYRYQTMASLPEADFEAHIAETKGEGRPLTSSGVYQRAQQYQEAPEERGEAIARDGLKLMERQGAIVVEMERLGGIDAMTSAWRVDDRDV